MFVGAQPGLVLAAEAARLQRRGFEGALAGHHREFALEEAGGPRRGAAHLALLGEGVDFTAAETMARGQVVGGAAHRHRGGVVERFPQQVGELRLAEREALARGVGGEREAAHGVGADPQHQLRLAQRDLLRGLRQDFQPGAADALHQQRGARLRRAGVEADMAGQEEGVGAGLADVGDDGLVDRAGIDAGRRDRRACRVDAEVGRRHRRQRAAELAERGACTGKQVHVVEAGTHAVGVAEAGGGSGHAGPCQCPA